MEWRGFLYALFVLLTVVESSNRSLKMWLPTVGTESKTAETFSLPIVTASIFVLVALVLSMYLVFEHLAAYNQPEEQKFLIGLILMVPVYALESMLLKMICALLAMILETFGAYGEGKFKWRYGYPYLSVVLNFSQTWALYCLVQFYSVTKDKLEPIKPLAKFLTFKSIVFLTWWHGVTVAFLFSIGAFRGSLAQELKTKIQDYISVLRLLMT